MQTEDASDMNVIKRDGKIEIISFDKILRRIKKLGKEADIQLNYTSLVMKVIEQLYDNIHTTQIDELAAEHCAMLASHHPDYGTLAGRIVGNHQKNTSSSFFHVTHQLYEYLRESNDNLLNETYYNSVFTQGRT